MAYAVVFVAGFGVSGTAYQAVFSVVPRASREQLRLFVDGVLIQGGMLIAGVFLIVVRDNPGLRVPLLVGMFVLNTAQSRINQPLIPPTMHKR